MLESDRCQERCRSYRKNTRNPLEINKRRPSVPPAGTLSSTCQRLFETCFESDIPGLDELYVLTTVFVRRKVKGVKRITSQKIIPVDRESLIFKMSPGSGRQLIKLIKINFLDLIHGTLQVWRNFLSRPYLWGTWLWSRARPGHAPVSRTAIRTLS